MPDDSAHPNYSEILYDVDGPVLTITLNRPDKLNAFTFTMMMELIDAFDQADADDDVRAVIVTGAGRGFCAGADLSGGGATFDTDAQGAKREPTGVLRDGVGLTMTLPMDIRLAADDAKIGFVFAKRGLVPEAASSWFLTRAVGVSRAM